MYITCVSCISFRYSGQGLDLAAADRRPEATLHGRRRAGAPVGDHVRRKQAPAGADGRASSQLARQPRDSGQGQQGRIRRRQTKAQRRDVNRYSVI